MDHQQQELRHAALQAFMESLELLERSLQSAHSVSISGENDPPLGLDLAELEAAATDIEQNLSWHLGE